MQTKNPIFDGMAKAMNEAAGAADGVRREAETVFHSQLQRFLGEADMVPREEFEALQDQLALLRDEVAALRERVEKLEN